MTTTETLRGVDLNLLVLLDALLQESSVTRAAERASMSTPAMSHALARLRDQLQDPLLVRAGRGMVLSERAQTLLPTVHLLMEEVSRVMSPTGTLDPAQLDRTFRIRATDHVLIVLGEAIDRLAADEAPGVTLQFLTNRTDDAEALRHGEVDLTVGVYSKLPPEMKIRRLFDDRFVCVVRQGHPVVKKRLTLRRFVDLEHVLVAPRGQRGGIVDAWLQKRGLERRLARIVPYFLAGLTLVAATDYVMTVSERIARVAADPLRLQIHKPPFPTKPYTLRALWHPRFDGNPAHRWLRSILVRAAHDSAPAGTP